MSMPAPPLCAASSSVEVMAAKASTWAVELERKERFLARGDFAFLFHAFSLVFYVRTWTWHFSPAAAVLPGAQGFGWFFRYLTFCSFTLQMVQLLVCCLAHMAKKEKRKRRLTATADQLSCALFGIANTVTALFFAIEKSTKGLVEGGALQRPPWLNLTVHVANSVVAWLDLLIVEERSFHGSSRHLALVFAVAYCAWLLVVRTFFGKFPYPILNKLPFPLGFAGFVVLGFAVVLATFQLGKSVKEASDRARGSRGGGRGASSRGPGGRASGRTVGPAAAAADGRGKSKDY